MQLKTGFLSLKKPFLWIDLAPRRGRLATQTAITKEVRTTNAGVSASSSYETVNGCSMAGDIHYAFRG